MDKILRVACGRRRQSNTVKNTTTHWDALVQRLRRPLRTPETYAQYQQMSHAEAGDVKDVGYFVGGHFAGGVRRKDRISHRDLVTLDVDFAPIDFEQVLKNTLPDTVWLAYTTHSHAPDKPRYRLLVPLAAPVTVEQYEPVARMIASRVGIDYVDHTSYQASRAMYWPSASCDGEYRCVESTGDQWLDPDAVLAAYADWRDAAEWPKGSRETKQLHLTTKKAGDPLTKAGVVGAFCRAYTIEAAMAAFLPGAYTPTQSPNRFTYTKGSTYGGAILYEDRFLYSNHESDPAGGTLCNAFDLVRLHCYGDLDDEAKPATPVNRLPSYLALCEWCDQDKAVRGELVQATLAGFSPVAVGGENAGKHGGETDGAPLDTDWLTELDVDTIAKKTVIRSSLKNAVLILTNDPVLAGSLAYNALQGRPVQRRDLPWQVCVDAVNGDEWADIHDIRVRHYINDRYGVEFAKDKTFDAVNLTARNAEFHPVRDYLGSLIWDGTPRAETLFIDYLGAEDTLYTRQIARKWLCGAVARAFDPGCKFDAMVILEGAQGTRKSTFFEVLAVNALWFGDGLESFTGREAIEAMQGKWLVEMAELQGFTKSEIEHIKAFISRRTDRARLAFERRVANFPRTGVFGGSTNDSQYLRDVTGNRRFWPVRCRVGSIDTDRLREQVGQIWAEAVEMYHAGEPLYLTEAADALARAEQASRTVDDGWAGIIEAWLLTPALVGRYDSPTDFDVAGDERTEDRSRVCAQEVWEDCLKRNPGQYRREHAVRINQVIAATGEWGDPRSIRFGARFGKQRGFCR